MNDASPASSVNKGTEMGLSFANGFIGVCGPMVSSRPLRLSPAIASRATAMLERDHVKVLSFGNRESTLSNEFDGEIAGVIRGRPFSLSQSWRLKADASGLRLPERALLDLDGRYSLCLAVGQTQLICATDIIGAGALYYCEYDDHLWFGTHLGPLVATLPFTPSYDQVGMANYLGGYTLFGARTIYENVRRLPACGYLVADLSDGSRLKSVMAIYGDLPDLLCDVQNTCSLKSNLSRISEIDRESIIRETADVDPILFLSGGRDSRAIAYSLLQISRHIPAVTFGLPKSDDVIGGQYAARSMAFEQTVVSLAGTDYSTYANEVVAYLGGVAGLFSGLRLAGYETATALGSIGLMGYLGDATTGGHLPASKDMDRDAPIRFLLQRIGRSDVDLHAVYRDELETVREEIGQFYDKLDGLAACQRCLIMDYMFRQATYISTEFDTAEIAIPAAYPFFHRERMKFWFNLPDDALVGQRLYDEWLDGQEHAIRRSRPIRTLSARVRRRLARKARKSGSESLVDWTAIGRQSLAWLNDAVDRWCDDERLEQICRASLVKITQGEYLDKPQIVALALAPCMARQQLARDLKGNQEGY